MGKNIETIEDALKYDGIELDKLRLNKLLMVMHHLSALAGDVAMEVELLLNQQGKFKYEIKHTHRMVRKLIAQNHKHLFGKLTDEQIELYGEDSDDLEKIVYKWAGLPPMFSGIKIKGNSKPEKMGSKFNDR